MQEVSYRTAEGLEAKVQEFFNGRTHAEAAEKMDNRLAELKGEVEILSVKREKIGRNYPCPCGSGKKFKKCCIDQAK